MRKHIRTTLFGSAMLLAAMATAAVAGDPSLRGAGSKISGDYQYWTPRTYYSYRQAVPAPAPVMVQTQQPTPAALAQAPRATRSFSYDPALTGCQPATAAPAVTAQLPQRAVRSYSYQPQLPTYVAPMAPAYRATAPWFRADSKVRAGF